MLTKLLEKFYSRKTGYGFYRPPANGEKAKGSTAKREITLAEIEKHMAGKIVIGAHSTSEDGFCLWGAGDFDCSKEAKTAYLVGDRTLLDQEKIALLPLAEAMAEAMPGALIEDSIGGYHVWLFFDRPYPVEEVYDYMRSLPIPPGTEVYPKQRDAKKFGNWLRLPGKYHSSDEWTKIRINGEWRPVNEAWQTIADWPTCPLPAPIPASSPALPVSQVEHREEKKGLMDTESIGGEPGFSLMDTPSIGGDPVNPPSDFTPTDEQVLTRIRKSKQGEEFENLFAGDLAKKHGSQSERDLAICRFLAFWTPDREQIDRIFRTSELYLNPQYAKNNAGKWEREDYRERTISLAIESCKGNHFNWDRTREGKKERRESLPRGEFWFLKEGARGELTWHIDYISLLRTIESEGYGFASLREDNPLDRLLVKTKDGIVAPADFQEVKDFAGSRVAMVADESDRREIEKALSHVLPLLNENAFAMIRPFATWKNTDRTEVLTFLEDGKEVAYFPFKNGIAEIRKDGVRLLPHSPERVVWKSQILPHDFVKDQGIMDFEFTRFLEYVCTNPETGERDTERFTSLLSSLGYLMHDYKPSVRKKAIVFTEASIDDDPQGRTGKGLIMQAIGKIRKTVVLDGRNFSFDSQFAFAQFTPDTKIFFFDDIGPRFPFRRLYSVITEGLSFEQKGKDRVFIPPEKSPKVSISTNYALKGNTESDKGRRFEMELLTYFSTTHTPEHEFGHLFFEDWDTEAWNRFYNLMLKCVELYLERGIPAYKSEVLEEKRLRYDTSAAFVEWADDRFEMKESYRVLTLVEEMAAEEPERKWNQTSLSKALKKYASARGLALTKRRVRDASGKQQTEVIFSKKE